MNCETARDYLLEADLTEFRGEGDGELARHLRTCAACREQARRILDQTAALAAALERVVPRTVTKITHQAGGAARTSTVRRWAIAVPLALAASLTVLLLRWSPGLPAPTGPSVGPTVAASAPLDVQVSPGRAVTVFQTENPNIVVIWSF